MAHIPPISTLEHKKPAPDASQAARRKPLGQLPPAARSALIQAGVCLPWGPPAPRRHPRRLASSSSGRQRTVLLHFAMMLAASTEVQRGQEELRPSSTLRDAGISG